MQRITAASTGINTVLKCRMNRQVAQTYLICTNLIATCSFEIVSSAKMTAPKLPEFKNLISLYRLLPARISTGFSAGMITASPAVCSYRSRGSQIPAC